MVVSKNDIEGVLEAERQDQSFDHAHFRRRTYGLPEIQIHNMLQSSFVLLRGTH